MSAGSSGRRGPRPSPWLLGSLSLWPPARVGAPSTCCTASVDRQWWCHVPASLDSWGNWHGIRGRKARRGAWRRSWDTGQARWTSARANFWPTLSSDRLCPRNVPGSVLVPPWVGLLLVEGWAVVPWACEAGLGPLHMCDAQASGGGRGAVRDSRLESSAGGREEAAVWNPKVLPPFHINVGPAHMEQASEDRSAGWRGADFLVCQGHWPLFTARLPSGGSRASESVPHCLRAEPVQSPRITPCFPGYFIQY